jgi:hypothetical protein
LFCNSEGFPKESTWGELKEKQGRNYFQLLERERKEKVKTFRYSSEGFELEREKSY